MKNNFYRKWYFWVLLAAALLGWYYAYTYYNLFWDMEAVATEAVALAEECVDLLR